MLLGNKQTNEADAAEVTGLTKQKERAFISRISRKCCFEEVKMSVNLQIDWLVVTSESLGEAENKKVTENQDTGSPARPVSSHCAIGSMHTHTHTSIPEAQGCGEPWGCKWDPTRTPTVHSGTSSFSPASLTSGLQATNAGRQPHPGATDSQSPTSPVQSENSRPQGSTDSFLGVDPPDTKSLLEVPPLLNSAVLGTNPQHEFPWEQTSVQP